ncbi:MAG: hypothetical protein ACFBSD_14765 [Paracoccaceae bacterium]
MGRASRPPIGPPGQRSRARILLTAVLAAAGFAAGAEPVAYTIRNFEEIPASLTGQAGDAGLGARLWRAEALGCRACHGTPPGAGRSPGKVRLWLVAPRLADPDTPMPSYYAAGQRQRPDDPRFGGPRLTAAEIEALVAFLAGR